MPPKRAKKPLESAASTSDLRLLDFITLGEEETNELALPGPPTNRTEHTYPSPPPLANETNKELADQEEYDRDEEEEETGKGARLLWSLEMFEQLIEVLHEVFEAGGAADNSFKKPTYEKVALAVRRVYKGPLEITAGRCKNKWADTKIKWGHWMFLSKQSGVGFNDTTELYEFNDSVWKALNDAHPKIIWHKTHVMPYRDEIAFILHDVQANGEGALSLADPTPLDPRLKSLDTIRGSASTSPAPSKPSKLSKTPYNKSKGKRVKGEEEDSDEGTLAPLPKKVDLGVAITGLSDELGRARRMKENFMTIQQKALQLLEKEYKERLHIMAFIDGTVFLQDEGNAGSFITFTDYILRDRWLEVRLGTELIIQTPQL
jgi:hypothetical protein